MNTLKYFFIIFCSLIILTGCAGNRIQSTPTLYPTYTPYPTSTPVIPTFTPGPPKFAEVGEEIASENWKMRVVSAQPVLEYGGEVLPSNDNLQFIVITVEYQYLGKYKMDFYPEAVMLVQLKDNQQAFGGIYFPKFYRNVKSKDPASFETTTYIQVTDPYPNDQVTGEFVYKFPKESIEFLLLFPESQPILVKLAQ